LTEAGPGEPAQDEKDFVRKLWNTLSESEQQNYLAPLSGFGYTGDGEEYAGKYLADSISPYEAREGVLAGSTDVADVSWVAPTAQLTAATASLGTSVHTWQMTTQGLSDFANRGMMRAASAMAMTGIQLFESKEDLQQAKSEFEQFRKKNDYKNPIPAGVQPSRLDEK
ncbi:amidohydrolase, partial [Salinicoccus roseus]|nr:amidohydrolase [Salinicoccus roseus]